MTTGTGKYERVLERCRPLPPIATAETPSRASEMPGQTRLRIQALEKTRIAIATTMEM